MIFEPLVDTLYLNIYAELSGANKMHLTAITNLVFTVLSWGLVASGRPVMIRGVNELIQLRRDKGRRRRSGTR